MKITKRSAFQITSGADAKKSKTNGDHSRSIRRNCKSFCLTKAVHRLQWCHSRLQWSSFVVVAEKVRRNVKNSEKSTMASCIDYFVADHISRNHKIKFESTVGFEKHLSCFKKSSWGSLDLVKRRRNITHANQASTVIDIKSIFFSSPILNY